MSHLPATGVTLAVSAATVIVCGFLASCQIGDECDHPGTHWCKGDVLHSCYERTNPRDTVFNEQHSEDCTERYQDENATCMVIGDEEIPTSARCVVLDERCVEGVKYLYYQDLLGRCLAPGVLSATSCFTKFPVVSEDNQRGACAYFEVSCEPGEGICEEGTDRGRYVCGEQGFYDDLINCPMDWTCLGGDCVRFPEPCTPGAERCSPDNVVTYYVCNERGHWSTEEICPKGHCFQQDSETIVCD